MEHSIWNWLPDLEANCSDECVLGIDFGSSNSCVSLWRFDKNRAKIIKSVGSQGILTNKAILI